MLGEHKSVKNKLPTLSLIFLLITLFIVHRFYVEFGFVYQYKNDSKLTLKNSGDDNLTTIYVVTATYARWNQIPSLLNVAQTLMLLKKIHWVVIEDAKQKSKLISKLLEHSNITYTHLNVKNKKLAAKDYFLLQNWLLDVALKWLKKYLLNIKDGDGVVFFMDDNNIYSLKLFDEIRKVKEIGVWPVADISPNRNNQTVEKVNCSLGNRKKYGKFDFKLGGFAMNVDIFYAIPKFVLKSYQTNICTNIVQFELNRDVYVEALADKCTKTYVWHMCTDVMKIEVNKDIKHNKKEHKIALNKTGHPKKGKK